MIHPTKMTKKEIVAEYAVLTNEMRQKVTECDGLKKQVKALKREIEIQEDQLIDVNQRMQSINCAVNTALAIRFPAVSPRAATSLQDVTVAMVEKIDAMKNSEERRTLLLLRKMSGPNANPNNAMLNRNLCN